METMRALHPLRSRNVERRRGFQRGIYGKMDVPGESKYFLVCLSLRHLLIVWKDPRKMSQNELTD